MLHRPSNYAALSIALLACGGCATNEPPPALETGPKRNTLEANANIVAVQFSADSRYFSHICEDGTIHLRHVLREEDAGTLRVPAGVNRLGTARGQRFAVVVPEGIEIWSSTTAREIVLPLARPGVRFLFFDPRGEQLAAATGDGTVTVWETKTGTEVRSLVPKNDEDRPLAPAPGFSVLYARGANALRIVGLDDSVNAVELEFPRDPTQPVTLSHDGSTLASVSPSGAVEVRRLPDGTLRSTLADLSTTPSHLALSPDGSVLAVDVGGAAVELWDTTKGERLDRFESAIWTDTGINFSPDGFFAAWVERDRKTVRFWSLAQDVVLWQAEQPKVIERARSVCPDLASMIRFRQAAKPFERGRRHLARDELVEAIREFEVAGKVFPVYPGLVTAAGEARARHQAQVRATEVGEELRVLEAQGDFEAGLRLLDEFLHRYSKFGTFGHAASAEALRDMLRRFHAAEEHRQAGRGFAAVKEFDAAVALRADLAEHHAHYEDLRQRLAEEFGKAADTAVAADDHAEVLRIYGDLQQIHPLDSREALRVGVAHQSLDQRQPATDAFESIAESAPEYSRARQSLAHLARDAGELKLARTELENARRTRSTEIPLETEYAELCERLLDFDATIAAWGRIAELDSADPQPCETIGRLEAGLGRFAQAGQAYRQAVTRSKQPRPDLLLKIAEAFHQAGKSELVLAAYLDLLELVAAGTEIPTLTEHPKRKITNRIRAIGYVRHRKQWIHRHQFLSEQGWVQRGEDWLRPEAAKLAGIADRFEARAPKSLRTQSEQRYHDEATQKGILTGMNRREVIAAWGFFRDQNVLAVGEPKVAYEQLLFANGRQVYLRNGQVFFWAE